MPRRYVVVRLAVFSVLFPLLFAGTAAAQRDPVTETSLAAVAVVSMFVVLVVGGVLILFSPEYTRRTTRRIHEEADDVFLYGIGVGILAGGVLFASTRFLVGYLIAVPLFLALIVAGVLGYLALGRVLTDDWRLALLVAVGASGIAGGVPILGPLLGLVLSSFGIGAAYLDHRAGGRSTTSGYGGAGKRGRYRR